MMTKSILLVLGLWAPVLASAQFTDDQPVANKVNPVNNGMPAPPAAVPLTNGQPVQYGPPKKNSDSSDSGMGSSLMQQLLPALQGLGGGGGAGGSSSGTSGGSTATPGNAYVTKGAMESCSPGPVPEKVWSAFKEAQEFRNSCGLANKGDKQKIVINDYSCDSKTPAMWIFDTKGNCIAKTAITFGAGVGGNGAAGGCPQACSDDGEHATPPGFHLTGYHPQSGTTDYGPDNSMEMVGLEGQRSSGSTRGILIHKAARPGSPSSWGCTGVCYDCYDKVKALLGFGALVYNYFGEPPHRTSSCNSSAGFSHGASCSLDRGAPEIGAVSLPAADRLQPSGGPFDNSSSDTAK
jgi:hypothetical protein